MFSYFTRSWVGPRDAYFHRGLWREGTTCHYRHIICCVNCKLKRSDMFHTVFWKFNEVRCLCPAAMTVSCSPSRIISTGTWCLGNGNLFIAMSTKNKYKKKKYWMINIWSAIGYSQFVIVHSGSLNSFMIQIEELLSGEMHNSDHL